MIIVSVSLGFLSLLRKEPSTCMHHYAILGSLISWQDLPLHKLVQQWWHLFLEPDLKWNQFLASYAHMDMESLTQILHSTKQDIMQIVLGWNQTISRVRPTLKISTMADLDLAPLRRSGTPWFSLSTYTNCTNRSPLVISIWQPNLLWKKTDSLSSHAVKETKQQVWCGSNRMHKTR